MSINLRLKTNNRFIFYEILWVLWLLLWVIVPFRLIRPVFFDKFIYMKDPQYGYVPEGEHGFTCAAGLNSDRYRDEEFYPKKKDEFLILVVGKSSQLPG